ncbi:MAG: zinc ribbon domain-containing protein [Gammaproteobacteria bacterium]|nr:MAG: zinc ribbon domain-containing protein [Gammaproteobacteria bacterium]RLA52075.1 MAG: zinc ribbon domain-containing protein [Gammaproteobacteria bacterium]
MPIYEYLCKACGHELEVIQKISDALLKKCPECNKAALKKKVSASAFRLSGSGWYETDFKTGNKKNLSGEQKPKGEGGEKKDSGDSGSKKSETKAASSPAPKSKSKSASGE